MAHLDEHPESVKDKTASDRGDKLGQASELSRREVIKLGAAAAIAASLGVGEHAGAQAAGLVVQQGTSTPAFFTPDEFALVDELSELIIPTDDHSPGARAAKVAAYIDFRLSEALEEKTRATWRDGLKLVDKVSQEINGKPFMQSTVDQRIAVLTRMALNELKPQTPEEVFFRELKGRVVRAYYTSEIGIKQEMEYKGNTSLKEFVGYDAT